MRYDRGAGRGQGQFAAMAPTAVLSTRFRLTPMTGTMVFSTRTETVTVMVLSSARRACIMPRRSLRWMSKTTLRPSTTLPEMMSRPGAHGAVHEDALVAGRLLCVDGGRHLLREHADAAAAIERHAGLLGRACVPAKVQTNLVPLYFPATISPGPTQSPCSDWKNTLSRSAPWCLLGKAGHEDRRRRKRQDYGQDCTLHRETPGYELRLENFLQNMTRNG